MEEKKIIKERGLNGQEITYIIDPSLNGRADRIKIPKKYEDLNKRLPDLLKTLPDHVLKSKR